MSSVRDELGVKPPSELIKWLNVLVYGEPGAGKTFLIGTAQDHPDTRPTLVLDIDGGTVTLRDRKDIDVISIRSIAELEKTYQMLHNSIDPETGEIYYKTVAIDSITELQKLDMEDIMTELTSRRPDLDKDVPSQREWGKSANHMRKIVRAFRDLPCNTIMTALATTDKDDHNVVTYYPSLPGKLRAEVPGFLDIVGYLYTISEDDELVRKLQVAKTRRIIAKDRTGRLGNVVENPSIPIMWELIRSAPVLTTQ